jgi:translation initiation factor 2 beta subunit (eIF-2beta)/eIF-5
MTEIEKKLLEQLEQLEEERDIEQRALQSELQTVQTELQTIQQQQKQILEALQRDTGNDSLEKILQKALSPLYTKLEELLQKFTK